MLIERTALAGQGSVGDHSSPVDYMGHGVYAGFVRTTRTP